MYIDPARMHQVPGAGRRPRGAREDPPGAAGSPHTVHYTLFTIHYTQYTIHRIRYTLYFTPYTLHCTLLTVHRPTTALRVISNISEQPPMHHRVHLSHRKVSFTNCPAPRATLRLLSNIRE